LFSFLEATVDSKTLIIGERETKKETCYGPAGVSKINGQGAPRALRGHSGNTLGCSGLLWAQLRAARGLTQLGSGSRSLPEAAVLPSPLLHLQYLKLPGYWIPSIYTFSSLMARLIGC